VFSFTSSAPPPSSAPLSVLTTLYANYDCNVGKRDVMESLVVSLAQACGKGKLEGGEGGDEEDKPRPLPTKLRLLCMEILKVGMAKFYEDEDTPVVLLPPPPSSTSDSDTPKTSELLKTKKLKSLLSEGAKIFNDKPSNGIDFLRENGLLESPPKAKSVARFLRNGIGVGLDKTILGSYLGELGKVRMGKERSDELTVTS